MKLQLQPARDGALKAVQATLIMAKVIIPVTIAIVALDKLSLMGSVERVFGPLVHFLGLPGEAALVIMLGFFVGVYAAIGAIIALPLSAREITVLAVIILTSHSLPMEGAVLKFTGLSPLHSIATRVAVAVLFGFFVNILYGWWGGLN